MYMRGDLMEYITEQMQEACMYCLPIPAGSACQSWMAATTVGALWW